MDCAEYASQTRFTFTVTGPGLDTISYGFLPFTKINACEHLGQARDYETASGRK